MHVAVPTGGRVTHSLCAKRSKMATVCVDAATVALANAAVSPSTSSASTLLLEASLSSSPSMTQVLHFHDAILVRSVLHAASGSCLWLPAATSTRPRPKLCFQLAVDQHHSQSARAPLPRWQPPMTAPPSSPSAVSFASSYDLQCGAPSSWTAERRGYARAIPRATLLDITDAAACRAHCCAASGGWCAGCAICSHLTPSSCPALSTRWMRLCDGFL